MSSDEDRISAELKAKIESERENWARLDQVGINQLSEKQELQRRQMWWEVLIESARLN
ncbi:hypothetical protein [Acidovorax sp. RAC01]|uniref:hypothetical protein n=1 Tax=Acidovorax sp. RAC01 TaxID=1842533 RepID=UPI000857488F|nr:hypothetical protein [Acidovorax sp. RAC01]AOG23498.1 hypothetical protein BSY15_2468 [Acidovorax sp. RAC01]